MFAIKFERQGRGTRIGSERRIEHTDWKFGQYLQWEVWPIPLLQLGFQVCNSIFST